jgi:hypothetical protein
MTLPPPCFTIGMVLARWWAVSGFLQLWHSGHRVQSWFHKTRESCFSWSESPSGAFWQTPSRLSCAFYWGVASVWPSGFLSPLWPRPPPPIAQFGRAASYRKSIGGSKLLTFKNDGGHRFLGDLQCCKNVLLPFPRPMPQIQSCLRALPIIPSTSWLGFCSDMPCQLWDLYIDRCVPFQNNFQSIEFTTGGLQWSCRKISRMINGNRIHLRSISSLIAKGLNTCVNKVSVLHF